MRGLSRDKLHVPKDGPSDVEDAEWTPEFLEETFRDIQKSLWHVFESLLVGGTTVQKTRLKVFAANVGQNLGFQKGEEILEKSDSTELTFDEFFSFVQTEMLDKIRNECMGNNKKANTNIDFDNVHNVCWMLSCNKLHTKKSSGNISLKEQDVFHIWRVFNFLAEHDEDDNPIFPLNLHPEEAMHLCSLLIQITGQSSKEDQVRKLREAEPFSFQALKVLFEESFLCDLQEDEISSGLKDLFSKVVLDVMKKGMLAKRGHKVKHWKDRWLVLTPREIRYYTARDEMEEKGVIKMTTSCKLEALNDKAKPNKFVIYTTIKPYEMCTVDVKTRNEWISEIQRAIDHCDRQIHFQRQAARGRRDERRNRRKKAEEEARRRKDDLEQKEKSQKELEEERRARAEAEARYLEQAALREIEQKRLKELEEIKNELERLLEEERQAKRDEEIVRALQARILEEEFSKREELEKLKGEQEEMLKCERMKRQGLEGQQEEQEHKLKEAQAKLDQLEEEKSAASLKLTEASEKLKQAEKDRTRLEERVKLWQTPTIGLARPIAPKAAPLLTHRGQGAFCSEDFKRHPSDDDEEKTPNFGNLHIEPPRSTRSNDVFDDISEGAEDSENIPSGDLKMPYESVPIPTS